MRLDGHWIAVEAPTVVPGVRTPAEPPFSAPRFLLSLDGDPLALCDPHGALASVGGMNPYCDRSAAGSSAAAASCSAGGGPARSSAPPSAAAAIAKAAPTRNAV
jgi:hypothetical protein